jgi:UDP-N-acetylmuramoyl-L-alanyl-D-glutamate--2,6-diaminopimelate ligase
MAAIASEGSHLTLLTSDNPRSEEPLAILAQMEVGLTLGRKSLTVVDRAEAIRTAVMAAEAGDIILVAGKGHETYQIIGTEKHHFDDHEEVKKAFAAKDIMNES